MPNGTAIEWAVKLGLALDCEIAERVALPPQELLLSGPAQGLPDLPVRRAARVGGRFVVPGPDGDREIGIVRAHLEEDAAKTVHVGGAGGRIHGAESSLVDFNRGGTPLVEIVTEPDVRSGEEARRFLQLLRQTVVELGISDAEMEKGSLRCDANVSVRGRRRGGLPHEDRAEEHELLQVRRGRDRGGGRAPDRALRVRRRGRPGDAPLRPTDRARSRRSARRSRPTTTATSPSRTSSPVEPPAEMVEARARGDRASFPGRASAGSRARSASTSPTGSSRAARDELFARVPGDDRRAVANVLMNQFAAAGVDPADVDGDELGKLIEARETIPRAGVSRRARRERRPGLRGRALPRRRPPSPTPPRSTR